MKLQEEYFKRHNIEVPPIYHVRNAVVILKLRVRPQVVLNIQWKQNPRETGHYVFDFMRPNHNGYLNRRFFSNMAEEPYIHEYNEYRNFIKNWAHNLNFIPVKSGEVRLAVWEMFLYCFDRWFAEHPELEEVAFNPVDSSLSLEQRNEWLDKSMFCLRSNHSSLWRAYDREFLRFELNYADWLAKLIEFYAEAS